MKRNLATLLIYRLYWFCFQSHTIFIYLLVLEPQSILLYNFVFSFTGYFRMWSTSEGLRLVLHTPQLEEPFPTQIQDKRFLISCYPRMCLVFFITQEHCWLIPDLSETPSFSSARPPPCPACNPACTVWCRAPNRTPAARLHSPSFSFRSHQLLGWPGHSRRQPSNLLWSFLSQTAFRSQKIQVLLST